MTLQLKKSGQYTYMYAIKSFRKDNGKCSTRVVRSFGAIEKLRETMDEDPVEWARREIARMTEENKAEMEDVSLTLHPNLILKKEEQRCYNGGYLFLQKIYYELGLNKVCANLERKHKNKYNLNEILSMLLYTRIMYPGSKRSSLEDSQRFIEQPKSDIHQVYRALSLLAKESDMIQADIYKRSLKLGKRRTQVIYYDCTNYYFESEEECGLRQYGHSKESRPNPIVQMGMFVDMDGMPLAFCVNPGNTAETVTLKPLEDKLRDNFGISKVVVCTDGGLSSYENRKNDHVGERAFITVQSLKKLEGHLQDWATETKGWRIVCFDGTDKPKLSDEEYDLCELDSQEYRDALFCRERWIKVGKKSQELEQRMIVTFSFKYREYLRNVRDGGKAGQEA